MLARYSIIVDVVDQVICILVQLYKFKIVQVEIVQVKVQVEKKINNKFQLELHTIVLYSSSTTENGRRETIT